MKPKQTLIRYTFEQGVAVYQNEPNDIERALIKATQQVVENDCFTQLILHYEHTKVIFRRSAGIFNYVLNILYYA